MLQCTFETRTRNTIVKLSSIKFIPLESLIDNSSSGSSFTRRQRFICTATNFFLPFVSFPLPPSPPPTKRKKEAGPKYRSLCSQALVTFATVTQGWPPIFSHPITGSVRSQADARFIAIRSFHMADQNWGNRRRARPTSTGHLTRKEREKERERGTTSGSARREPVRKN